MHRLFPYLLILLAISSLATAETTPASHQVLLNPSLEIALNVQVVLIGYDGDSNYEIKVESREVQAILAEALPRLTPSNLETGESMSVDYKVNWRVSHAPPGALQNFERALNKELSTAIISDGIAYIYTDAIVPVLNELQTQAAKANGEDPERVNTIFLVNPNYEKLQFQHGAISYTYSLTRTKGIGSSVWIGINRWILVDLAAHASEYGSVEGKSAISHHSLPYITKYFTSSKKGGRLSAPPLLLGTFEVDLSVLCVRAVKYVFASDMQYPVLHEEEQVFIPVIVLTNHNEFNPFHTEEEFGIKMDTIEREIGKMMTPTQKYEVLVATHGLHDHKKMSMAIYKSLRTHSVFSMTASGTYNAVPINYLDSKVLLHELVGAGDLLTKGLLSTADESRLSAYKFGTQNLDKKVKILPVYVLSLLGVADGLTLEHYQLVAASKDAIVVLQTNETEIAVPYFYNHRTMNINGKQPTRHIISVHREVKVDFTFAFGYHPYGVFSQSEVFSTIFLDNIQRNHIISRCDVTVRTLRTTLEDVESFAKNYLYNPMGDPVTYNDPESKDSFGYWTDVLFSKADQDSTILVVITKLKKEVTAFSGQLTTVMHHLSSHRLDEALQYSTALAQKSRALREYVRKELASVELEVACCYLHLDMDHPLQTSGGYLVFFSVVGFMGVAGLILVRGGTSLASLVNSTLFKKRKKSVEHTL